MIENKATSEISLQQTLSHMSMGLDVLTRQAWLFSMDDMAAYLRDRTGGSMGLSQAQAAYLGAARLNWLLATTRASLSGLFTFEDISTLLTCFQSEAFFPHQIETMAEALCDEQGIEVGEVDGSAVAPLVAKLLALVPAQRLALADVLEQTWHVGLKLQKVAPAAFLESLGIVLADD